MTKAATVKYGVTIVLTMIVAMNSNEVRMKCSRVVGSFYTTTTFIKTTHNNSSKHDKVGKICIHHTAVHKQASATQTQVSATKTQASATQTQQFW